MHSSRRVALLVLRLLVAILPMLGGFYDSYGNVREWTSNWHANFTSDPSTDPTGPATGTNGVNRGGGWSKLGMDFVLQNVVL